MATLLPLAVVVIMFSLGLGLTPADFWRIVQRPRAFCLGALCQVLLLPVVGYLVILAFGFTEETAVGIMILAACPGGAVSNIITRIANWDVALSVTLTASFSLTSVVTIPLILAVAVSHFMGTDAPDVDISRTAFTAFLLTALPIAMGVTLRRAAPRITAAMAPILSRVALVLFMAVILAAIVSNWQVVTDNFARLGAGLLCLVLVLSVMGAGVARLFGASDKEAKTIAIETSVQNGALGLAVAGLLAPEGPVFNAFAIPAALYSVVLLTTALPVFLWLGRRR